MATTLHTLDIDGVRRQFLVHVPDPFVGKRLPAVLFLHGAGATAAWSLEETGWSTTADREGFVVVVPEGLAPDPARRPSFFRNPQLWNDSGTAGMLGPSRADDVSFLRAVLDRVLADYPIDPRRVFVTGFSNGACMTFRVGAELSDRVAALAPVAGHLRFEDPRPLHPRPTLFLIGAADPLIPLAGGVVTSPWDGALIERPPVSRTLERWAAALGGPTEPVRDASLDGVRAIEFGPGRNGATLSARIIDGLGHHWPGGRGRFNPQIAGATSDRLRANDVIWDFFRRHPLE